MKHIFQSRGFLMTLVLLLPMCMQGRELVITLNNGQRYAYHLSTQDKVKMVPAETSFTLGNETYLFSNVEEQRIYTECPEDAIPVGIEELQGLQEEDLSNTRIYDLQGRNMGLGTTNQGQTLKKLPAGVYIVNNRKVMVR